MNTSEGIIKEKENDNTILILDNENSGRWNCQDK